MPVSKNRRKKKDRTSRADEPMCFVRNYLPGETPEEFVERVREMTFRMGMNETQKELVLATVEVVNSMMGKEGFVAITHEQLAERLTRILFPEGTSLKQGEMTEVATRYSNRVGMMMYFKRYRGEDGVPIYARYDDPVNEVLSKRYEAIPVDYSY
jgi:hypothetical protein